MSTIAVIVTAGVLTLAACVEVDDLRTRSEIKRYSMLVTGAELHFLPGSLVGEEEASALPQPFAPHQEKAVSCRADIVVAATGLVSDVCTVCTDPRSTAWRASDTYARRLRFRPGEAGRTGAMTFAYAPQRPDGSTIIPRIAPPAEACKPHLVRA